MQTPSVKVGTLMDLTKLFLKSKQGVIDTQLQTKQIALTLFSALKDQLEQDLKYLTLQKDLDDDLFFSKVQILFGQYSEDSKDKKNTSNKDKCYLFIYIPGNAGFLIEPNSTFDTLNMYRATRVYQHLGSIKEDNALTPYFVLKSDIIGEFKILDENYVRVSDNQKTLSVAQMSEMLILLSDSMKQHF